MKNLGLFQMLMLIFIISSCERTENNHDHLSIDRISGYVQKGPYLNGSSITLRELSSGLIQTGKTYSSQILDNQGSFEMNGIDLISQFAELRVDGFYFNEISNGNASAQLTLYALSDLTDKSSLNVNVLSSLEKRRVEYLVAQGSSFADAKSQAQSEIIGIFEISEPEMMASEQLDITQPGDDHAVLLAISVILQGHLQVADLSELLANLSNDIYEDGALDDAALGTILINHARTITLSEIRKNLEDRYQTQGRTVTVPDFEEYVNQFVENTPFEFTAFIEYPATGDYGANILDRDKTDYSAGAYSMKAILPAGTDLKVKISGRNWYFPAFQENTGWEYTDWNEADTSRTFTSTRTGEIDFEIMLESFQDSSWTNRTNILVYENEDMEPTWTREIMVQ
jgi:hypothetical protein